MKVLFASAAHTPDFSGGFLWRALQDLLGGDNVNCPACVRKVTDEARIAGEGN